MKQIAPLLIALATAAAASSAAASPFIDYPDDPGMPTEEVVEIVVAPEDLSRCQATLAMVTGAPVAVPQGAPETRVAMDAEQAPALPVATCVTEPRSRPVPGS
ncbi:hypothetical protein FHY55_15045 [Oceanicola sp. D3]|uniref:hypothetical protein n=1 Tax=Oceanicola sp. D3 TaxID=2587163 RepID=UPI001123A4D2|nr:hypothetical protein [Oceanicola sp. D3]QDC10476.1 hypothetical protein FHY55_15045 [Oceanicola sp. D3]